MTKFRIVTFLIFALLSLSGCATYSVKKGDSPYNKGYIVTRYDRVIPEYTIGKDNSVPDEQVAKERFERRRKTVENYYKKMGYMENRFKQNFIDPPLFILQTIGGIFRLPSIAISDYKYNHDPKYRETIDKKEDAEYKAEKERIKKLKDQLNAYIAEDLRKEAQTGESKLTVESKQVVEATEPAKEVPIKEKPAQEAISKEKPVEQKPKPVVKQKVKEKPVQADKARPTAIIIAKPAKGFSPLSVQFYGYKSTSPNARIVSYEWDFGDGDTSTKKNPTNTYWSTTYGARQFDVTLTVKDNKGRMSQANTVIEVMTK